MALTYNSAKSKSSQDSNILNLFRQYKPSMDLNWEYRNFSVTLAQSPEEILETFKLRYECFFEKEGIDYDAYDFAADHLLIKDKEQNNKIIGTYRLLRSERTSVFYSEAEFIMNFLHRLPGTKVEAGRACLHRDYRKGIALNILWQGLGKYVSQVQPDWLFGCSSFTVRDIEDAAILRTHLLSQHLSSEELRVWPLESIPLPDKKMNAENFEKGQKLVPSLLKSYLKLGAVICGEPCWDPEFECLDYLTLLNVKEIPDAYAKKFGVQR